MDTRYFEPSFWDVLSVQEVSIQFIIQVTKCIGSRFSGHTESQYGKRITGGISKVEKILSFFCQNHWNIAVEMRRLRHRAMIRL